MSFLEKEETKQSTFWDWVVGIGLIIVVGGFTVYYQYQKKSSLSRFKQADEFYQGHHIKEAGKLYEELKSAQYLTTANDSTIYARLDTLETLREAEAAQILKAKDFAGAKDSVNLRLGLEAIPFPEILSDEDKGWFDSVNAANKWMPRKP